MLASQCLGRDISINHLIGRLFVAQIVIICFTTSLIADTKEQLDKLVEEYRSYELPMPTENAKLDVRTHTTDGIYSFYPCLGEMSADGKFSPWYGADHHEGEDEVINLHTGFEGLKKARERTPIRSPFIPYKIRDNNSVFRNSLTSRFAQISEIDCMEMTPETIRDDRYKLTSEADPLILAIQCKALGREELAKYLFEAAHQQPVSIADDTLLLATYAWDFWNLRFRWPKEREQIIHRLETLLASRPELKTKARLNILEDMKRTIVPVTSKPGTVEADIDELLAFNTNVEFPLYDMWETFSPFNLEWDFDSDQPAYIRLKERGLTVVPMLMKHIDDFRMTRTFATSRHYHWNVRIADIVAILLMDIAQTNFAYDVLDTEGRGVMLDKRHVDYWWSGRDSKDSQQNVLPENLMNDISETTPDSLRNAVIEGRVDIVRKLIDAGVPLDLTSAAMLNWTDEIAKMLNERPWLIKRPSRALPAAARAGSFDAVKLLLDRGADTEVTVMDGNFQRCTALSNAVSAKHSDIVKLLLERGASTDVDGFGYGGCPIREVIRVNGYKEIQKLFEEQGKW